MIQCSSQYGLLTGLIVVQSAYGCSLLLPPEGSFPFAAREYLPRLGNPFGPSRMNVSALWFIINEIDGVSMDIRLLVFPSPESSLSSLREIISPARRLRSGRVG